MSTTSFHIASRGERNWGVVLGLGLGFTLSQSLLPSLQYFFQWLPDNFLSKFEIVKETLEMISFPMTAAFFYLSLPSSEKYLPTAFPPRNTWLTTAYLPLLIALGFGFLRRFAFGVHSPSPLSDLFWYVLLIPVGEELLFRGWVYNLCARLYRNRFFTATNPLPMALWTSSFAFSLWHLQNLGNSEWGFVLFQLLYTFCTGLWLGYLRWTTGKITIPILTHLGLNLATMLPLFLG